MIDNAFEPVPRTRGDEPLTDEYCNMARCLFPAHAGMNRLTLSTMATAFTVPRTRGDEPVLDPKTGGRKDCSPHTRG